MVKKVNCQALNCQVNCQGGHLQDPPPPIKNPGYANATQVPKPEVHNIIMSYMRWMRTEPWTNDKGDKHRTLVMSIDMWVRGSKHQLHKP